MTITLTSPLDAYVAASNGDDTDRLAGLFTDDAVIHDEGQEYHGREGVRAWLAKSEKAYTFTMEPQEVAERDGLTVLTATVAGSFPGSPVDLDFDFTLRDGLIAGSAIHP